MVTNNWPKTKLYDSSKQFISYIHRTESVALMVGHPRVQIEI